jgi:hypothetical protein
VAEKVPFNIRTLHDVINSSRHAKQWPVHLFVELAIKAEKRSQDVITMSDAAFLAQQR